jgi:hypothetical protein
LCFLCYLGQSLMSLRRAYQMAVMRRIFYVAGVEGRGLCAIRKQLIEDGMPSPAGKAQWDLQSIRKLLKRDLYRPHTLGTLPLGGSGK